MHNGKPYNDCDLMLISDSLRGEAHIDYEIRFTVTKKLIKNSIIFNH